MSTPITEITAIATLTAQISREHTTQLEPHEIARVVAGLYRNARTLGNVAVARCNRPVTEREERRAERADQDVHTLCRELGLTAKTNDGDPRGYAVLIRFPSGATNSFAGDGWGIG